MNRECLRRRDTHRVVKRKRICTERRGNKPEENKVEIIHELN